MFSFERLLFDMSHDPPCYLKLLRNKLFHFPKTQSFLHFGKRESRLLILRIFLRVSHMQQLVKFSFLTIKSLNDNRYNFLNQNVVCLWKPS